MWIGTATELGYEPRPSGDGIVLDNCPFHAMAARHTELICGINKEFIGGLLAGLGCAALHAELRPRPGGCCVRVSA
jgi:predicted ArsR family transcriptional regulator